MSHPRAGGRARPRSLRDRALAAGAGLVGPLVSRLPRGGRTERLLLRLTWAATSAEMLDRYLVSGYQNPRINVQSILLRHFLVDRLFGRTFDELEEAELRFAVELNEALRVRAAELGVRMGSYVNPAKLAAVSRVDETIADRDMEFVERWRGALEDLPAPRASVLELACGSANDYRAMVEAGIAAHLDYRGLDLAAKNIDNARRRFPGVAFEVGDVTHVRHPDRSFDYVVASDIFEHLSLEGMERALAEASRIARRGVALTFFNMAEVGEHVVQRRNVYFWNRLSSPRIEERLRAEFGTVEVVGIHAMLRDRFGYEHTYDRHAVSIFADRSVA
jgi:SAM-dependent methyltransferase